MKRIIFIMLVFGTLFASCNEDDWSNDNLNMEHVYYYGFQDWGNLKNNVVYNLTQGETVAVATQFWSEYTRSYSPKVSYYVSNVPGKEDLILGVDYQIVDKDGNSIRPNDSGSYEMIWTNAVKGIQYIYVKALNGKKGSIRLLTFDPAKTMDNMDIESTIIVKTDQYEVRAFTENFYVTIKIQ